MPRTSGKGLFTLFVEALTASAVPSLEVRKMTRLLNSEDQVASSRNDWIVEYGTLTVDCRDEEDAKRVVRGLHHRARVIARTGYGILPARRLEGAELANWLSE
jgi:hypothetical protein